ncbi:urease accessory protein UreE [Halogranum rubrum]|uniref:UreE urease accessory N-terminal domain-containing protein n=1 Tax=Halogranum salarium B-1 TaxID=1210908 RepID=J3EUN1_9EURY|nr:hypothetical protein [Halogranum salarium]EJN58127.1 hypothetical protein HSB1_35440 [Halogranum salarium B-1]
MTEKTMLVANGVKGNVHEDDTLHEAYHDHDAAGTLERVVVDATTRRRSRFRTTTEIGTDLGVVVNSSDGLRPGDVLAVDDSDRLFVVEFEQETAVVVELPDGAMDTETLAAAVAFGHVVGNKHWDLAVDGGRVYVRVGADGPRVADELREHLLDGATLHHEQVDPTLFDTSGGGVDHDHTHPLTRPTEGNDE